MNYDLNKRNLNLTTIPCDKTTRVSLKHIARKDQTWDQLLQELVQLKLTVKQKENLED